jgi:hypothetical protein
MTNEHLPPLPEFGYVSKHTDGSFHFNKTFVGVYRDTALEVTAVVPLEALKLQAAEIERLRAALELIHGQGDSFAHDIYEARAIARDALAVKGGV